MAHTMHNVSHAITLNGGQLVQSILLGEKGVENRGWRIPPGWYGLHCGLKHEMLALTHPFVVNEDWYPEIQPEETQPHGAIVALIRLERARDVTTIHPNDRTPWHHGQYCHESLMAKLYRWQRSK